MKLIDEIIEVLISDNPNLQSVFLKTKFLLYKLGERQLKEWINQELNGYGKDDKVPNYRLVYFQVFGVISNGYSTYKNHPLVLSHLKQELKDSLTEMHIREGIGSIEEYAKKKSLDIIIPPECYFILSKPYSDTGYIVQSAWKSMPVASIKKIIIEVKSRLLDFMLELSEKIPNDINHDLKSIPKGDISKIFNHNIYGNNNTIVSGDLNNSNISNNIIANDIDTLEKFLLNNKISQGDIDLLKEAINQDKSSSELEKGKFGSSVAKWIGAMISKSVSKVSDIGADKLVNLLTKAIIDYYGF